ncbi:uncharacterized protein ATNIH1004_000901 [Aspergillus tanneri]|uniref:Uncharacterized protein n=1 Tax=Aspergillus tanneri TaxID=1220188 RepID=A0A5M9MY07_9EURO|nr:uncharacterized protein ATNIH1004_000901 [Aspergillus tanneri]KAA8652001.1 hypothetical protein ATNIH1004_000901 [Aspergillus tanneri]
MAATLPIELIRPPQNRREDLSSCTTILSLLAWYILDSLLHQMGYLLHASCPPKPARVSSPRPQNHQPGGSYQRRAHLTTVNPRMTAMHMSPRRAPKSSYTETISPQRDTRIIHRANSKDCRLHDRQPTTLNTSHRCLLAGPPRHRGAGRVIQIYGLQGAYEDNNLTSPAEHVLGQRSKCLGLARAPRTEYEDADGVVDALEFTDNGTLLRITIGKGSTIHRPTRVRYLDNPDLAPHPPDLTNWRAAQLSISRFCRSGSLIYRSRHTQPRLQLPRTPTSPPLGAHDSPERLLL